MACFGHNRDRKKGKLIIVYGFLTDEVDRPVAVEVYPGNTGDPCTVPDQVEKLRKRFRLCSVVLICDRAMPTQTQIDKLKNYPGFGWISAEDTVCNYKRLEQVESAFRCMKGIDLLVRPIHHSTEDDVRAHIFLCMLSYYLEYHMRKFLAPLFFEDEEPDEGRKTRDPVKPAKLSASAKRKKRIRLTPDGFEIHSFQTLFAELATRSRNRCRVKSDLAGPTFYQLSEPTPLHKRAFRLLGL